MSEYSIVLTTAAKRNLQSFSGSTLERIDRKILELGDDPRARGIIKLSGSDDMYRARVGNYRILFQINDSSRSVIILNILPRDEAYRRFN